MRKSLLVAALLLSPTAFAATTHWEYSGEAGPAKWASLTPEYGQCAGSNQSPVNLTGMVEAKLAPLQFHYQTGGKTLVNNGHTIQVNYAPGSTLELDGMRFELKQFHFHAPSENLIEGKSYPLEGHLVHANDRGELAVVAVMFEPGRANAALSLAWQVLPAKAGESHGLKEPVSAEQLLPAKRDYYRFSGSLTTPPCSEGVRWLVMKEPVQVSQAQIDAFKAV
ncbi:carbonic anhydrase, partial [Salmonella enterica subsp. enterica serovar Cerro str. CFSAN001690]